LPALIHRPKLLPRAPHDFFQNQFAAVVRTICFTVRNVRKPTFGALFHVTAFLKLILQDFEKSHLACEKGCDYFSLCSGGYNLVKFKRSGSFEATETPECFVHVKTFADTLLEDLQASTQ
jgi:hypothetical protein